MKKASRITIIGLSTIVGGLLGGTIIREGIKSEQVNKYNLKKEVAEERYAPWSTKDLVYKGCAGLFFLYASFVMTPGNYKKDDDDDIHDYIKPEREGSRKSYTYGGMGYH
jgi:hypothetical protein